MKRQTQLRGERYWAGDDLLDLQNEPLEAIDAFFAEYPPCIIRGCKVESKGGNLYDISAGYVSLQGKNAADNAVQMVVPAAQIKGTSLPVYLKLAYATVSDVYGDGEMKPIRHDYYAEATTIKPSAPYLELSTTAKVQFKDVIQDDKHRFTTDVEKAIWNNKVDKIAGKGLSTNDYTTAEKTKLAEIGTKKITGSEIDLKTITKSNMADRSIGPEQIEIGGVTQNNYADNSISMAKLNYDLYKRLNYRHFSARLVPVTTKNPTGWHRSYTEIGVLSSLGQPPPESLDNRNYYAWVLNLDPRIRIKIIPSSFQVSSIAQDKYATVIPPPQWPDSDQILVSLSTFDQSLTSFKPIYDEVFLSFQIYNN